MIKSFKSLRHIGLFAFITMFLIAMIIPITNTFAAISSRVVVNGTVIYDSSDPAYSANDGYNITHGVSGVSYNTSTNILNLTSTTLESIYANGDLTINLNLNNAIDATTSNIALEARGNLTIIGSNGSSLNVSAMTSDDRAIEIASGSTLTIGNYSSPSDIITVSIQRGSVNAPTISSIGDNVWNYSPPISGPGPSIPSEPLTLSIGGSVVIDETAVPEVTSASGEGWSISQNDMGGYSLELDQGATIGYITASGDGDLTINGDGAISSNIADGLSINMLGMVNIFGGESDIDGDVNLSGGIYTQGFIDTYDRAFTIGSAESPSSTGVTADMIYVSFGDLTVYTTGIGLQYHDDTPEPGRGLVIDSSSGKTLRVASSSVATANTVLAYVSGGGSIDLTYTDSLGDFSPQAGHFPWIDMNGTEEENMMPDLVDCVEGESVEGKYRLTTSYGNFLLESTAGTLYNLGWDIPDAEDSVVLNGTVNVVAANGYKQTFGGYTDYLIEAGTPVTIELLPNYGYQYVSGGLNGNQTMPEAGKASYNFVMPSEHLHLSAIFEPKSDIVNINDDSIQSASITMPANEINGNAELTINDSTDADEGGFRDAAGDLTVAGYLDLSLNEVIYKGTTNESWKTPLTSLDEEMTINIELADELQGYSDYTVLRDHEGTITELDSSFDPETGILSFNTDSYSDYAIAHGEKIANPNTYDGILKYIALAFLSAIGIFTVLLFGRKKKNFLKFK